MVLRRDFHFLRGEIFYRVGRAVMAELQFECAAAESEPAKLVAQADAENRHAANELANVCDGVADRFGIAGAVREENAIRFQGKHILGGSLCGDDRHSATMVYKKAQNILLDAEIVGDH